MFEKIRVLAIKAPLHPGPLNLLGPASLCKTRRELYLFSHMAGEVFFFCCPSPSFFSNREFLIYHGGLAGASGGTFFFVLCQRGIALLVIL